MAAVHISIQCEYPSTLPSCIQQSSEVEHFFFTFLPKYLKDTHLTCLFLQTSGFVSISLYFQHAFWLIGANQFEAKYSFVSHTKQMANRRQNGLESPTMARSYNKGGFKTSWSQKPLHTCNIPTDVRDKYSVETSEMFVNLTSPTTLIECILPTTLIEYWDGPTSPRPGGRKLLLAKLKSL